MKPDKRTLYLVRHAKALKGNPGGLDIDRQLHETGINEATVVAEELFRKHEIPQLIISSSAARCVSTALIFQRILLVPFDNFRISDKLYEIGLNDLFEFVASLDDKFHSIMIFGHNPAFTYFATKMDPDILHMSTGSVIRFDFDVEKWRHSSYLNAEKKLFLFPQS